MLSKSQHAFVDEYGNADLETSKPGVSTHFIVTAVLIDSERLKTMESDLDEIRRRHFQTGEIKSSGVGKDTNRRSKVLLDLSKLDFHFYSVVIDKREIRKDSGLIYKQSFLKFLNDLLYRKLFQAFPEIQVVADEHGSKEFMEGFLNYVKKKYPLDFFRKATFEFSPSHQQPLIQVADFISGTIARVFDPTKASERAGGLLTILKAQTLMIEVWPPILNSYTAFRFEKNDGIFDQVIREQSHFQALQFIQKHQNCSDEAILHQVETIKYLLLRFILDDKEYVSTKEILETLTFTQKERLDERYFRSNVIAKLRDYGVIIASRSDGYKIPGTVKDMHDFVEHTNGYVQPMLDRLTKARNQFMLTSKGRIDILDQPQHNNLKRLLDKEP